MNPRRNHEATKKNEGAFVVPVIDSGRAVWPKLAFAVAEDDRVAVRVNSRRNHEATKKNELHEMFCPKKIFVRLRNLRAFVVPVIDGGRAVWPKL